MPADDDQPACALSGERFDTFWDDAEGQWCFRGAVRLDAEQAARCNPDPVIIAMSMQRAHGKPSSLEQRLLADFATPLPCCVWMLVNG